MCELLGLTPTNTLQLYRGKQMGEEVIEEVLETEREREWKRGKLPKANWNIRGLRQT